jgi:KDO2-lipid IV(A) lauroyltransferase
MKAIIFYLLLPIIYLISLLPFGILYIVSDGLYLLVFHLFGYRKKVVYQNLKNSFPEKSEKEIDEIARKFYKNLCDIIIESIKSMTMSEKDYLKRCKFESTVLANELFEKNKSVICILGHYGNWEWAAPAASIALKHQFFVIYKRLSNPYFNKMIYNNRSRFGTKLIESNDVVKEMFKNKEYVSATVFVGDQTPFPEGAYWTRFLNQDTPVFRGTEIIAKKFNYPVIWVSLSKIKRGYYQIHYRMLVENPKETKEGEISEMHTLILESDIQKQPEMWLWSHKRWKHRKPMYSSLHPHSALGQ